MADLVMDALSELMPGEVRRGELSRGGRLLRWVEAGAGRPAVVFDAGLGEPGTLAWAGVLPLLAPHVRVIAYDRAGVGASDPVAPLTADIQIGDLAAIAAGPGGGRCIVAGHSWGGLLAQIVALCYPELVAGLALIDPAHEEVWAAAPWWVRAMQSSYGDIPLLAYPLGLQRNLVRGVYRPFAGRLTSDRRVRSVILDAYASCYQNRTQVRVIRQENRLATESIREFREMRLAATLPAVPVTVLSATRGLPARLRRPWTTLQAGLAEGADGEHIIVAGAGHSIHQERPAAVADAILQVIARVRRPAQDRSRRQH